MTQIEHFDIKKLDKKGLKTLVDWARLEGWNPGEHDFVVFWKTDPNGYYGFYLEDKLIAGGAVVSYNGEFGFMGLFIVHPDFRGQGVGNKLWYLRRDLLLERLKEEASIGMDGVVAMQPFYAKGGFKIAFKDERYKCIGQKTAIHNAISIIEMEDFERLLDYDLECLGYERKEFLRNWLVIPNSKSFKYSEDNKIKGYALIRKVASGHKIGPLFADNDSIAEELYKACLNSASGEAVYLDIPIINLGALKLVQKYKAKYVFECARMYHGKPPRTNIDKVYGITTFELG